MFGKAPRGVSERPKIKVTPKVIPSWLWLIVLVLSGICLMIFLVLWRPWQPSVQKTQENIGTTVAEETNQDYRFYDLLPQQQVTPIPEQAIPEQKASNQSVLVIQAPVSEQPPRTDVSNDPFEGNVEPTIITRDPTYILQVRSFEDPDQADARRAEIVLNGLSAEVIIANEANKIWYRVVSGPYYSEDAAKIAQQSLQNGGIDSFIVKQPH